MTALRRTLARAGAVTILASLIAGFVATSAYRNYAGWPDPANPNVTLNDVETIVARRLPLPELTETELAARLALGKVILFDVRETDEFSRSHLPGARRIDPNLSAEAFRERFGADVKGRAVVFYCAVGVRSGHMLARLQPALMASDAAGAYNLRGGIFRWRAAGRPLMAETPSGPGGTATVHPYNPSWGLLLERTLQSKPVQSKIQRP
jgi:rhodanese-related sulfurtransferase